FVHLYEVGNLNLRNALKYCEDYALWLSLEYSPGQWPSSSSERLELLEAWMAVKAEEYLGSMKNVGARAWSVFDGIVVKGAIVKCCGSGNEG
ncbi:MAG TPA: hypothetical protein VFE45_17340, partial [Coriobacteriia bacterium]|nr:hypothetical protein [Coriobacteriia bacterium]